MFNKRSPKDAAWKTELFAYVISRERRAPQAKKIQSNVSQVQRSLRAKLQLSLNTFKMPEKSRGRSCTRPFNFSFNRNFLTYYACTAFNWVFSVTKKKLRIAGFFASLPFLTRLCDKRLKPSIHCVQL